MLKRYCLYSLTSLISAGSCFLMSGNYFFALAVFLSYALYFILSERFLIFMDQKRNKKRTDLNTFIHDFLLAYSYHSSLDEAMNLATTNVSYPLVEQTKLLEEYDVLERLNQLRNYFRDPLYELFLENINLAKNKQADILLSADFLREENDRVMHERKLNDKKVYQSLGEFIMLWAVSFFVLVMMRFAINNHFDKIANHWVYLLGLAIYYAFFLLSIHLFIRTIHRRACYE